MAALFIIFAVAMAAATFVENSYGTETAQALIYNAWWFELVILLLALNFVGNIFKFRLFRKEKLIVLIFHLAFLLIILGAGITRYISYEGIMPIKEGETSNRFHSSKNFITVSVNDGEGKSDMAYKPVLFSAIGGNNYSYKTNFADKDVKVKLKGYIPNAKNVFVESADGDEYLLFVESGGEQGHEHYIKKGTSERFHGLKVGFNSTEENVINIESINDSLTIKSVVDGDFYKMEDHSQGKVVKDSVQGFSIASLYSIAGFKFVIPKKPIKGSYQTIRGNVDESSLAQLTFDVTADNETKEVVVYGDRNNPQHPTRFSIGNINFAIYYGAMEIELPFSIKLNDFQLEKYPGSNSPMSFASEVTVIDDEKTFDFRIFMNNILNYKGYKFFQSSYNITSSYEQTFLSVNHDFWGSTITYIGYFLLYAGLILILFIKNTRFAFLRKSLKKLKNKKATLSIIILLFASNISFSQHNHIMTEKQIDSTLVANEISLEHAEKFSKVVIQDAGGRMKPVHTYASELLRKVSKHDNFKGMNAVQVFLSIQQNPRIWFQIPVIYIERGNNKLRDIIGIPHNQKYAPLSSFYDADFKYKLGEFQAEAQKNEVKNKFEKDVINVDKRVNLLFSAIRGSILRIFPVPDSKDNSWVSQENLKSSDYKGKDSVFVKKMLPAYFVTLSEASKSNNYADVDGVLEGIIKLQKKYGSDIYPPDDKIDLEIMYNKHDIFKKLFSYYMYISVLMFLFVIIQIFQKNRAINILTKLCIAIIVSLFILHTGGLITRWIVGNHAPFSNSYESMVYLGWAIVLFGLILGRRSSLTIAAAAFITSIVLMVAHWNWMDPEIENLVPVLNSFWLNLHVSTIVMSYGPFALGMILGFIALLLMVLTTKSNKEKLKDTIAELTTINEMALTIGIVLLTIGNFLGGQWANESWGRYWGWDPKETWALISIMVYALVLHLRLIPGLRGKFVFNFASIIAFASIMMTYFGVNFYLSGLHAYAGGDQAITPSFVYYSIGVVFVIGIIAYFQYNKHYKKQKK